jgi:hypothetical protein
MTERHDDAYTQLLKNYRDLTMAVRNIREAVERSFGASLLPSGEHTGATPVDECEVIARAIYALRAASHKISREATHAGRPNRLRKVARRSVHC